MEPITLSIHFECGLQYESAADKEQYKELARKYFERFISQFPEFIWCDVIINDAAKTEPKAFLGASRNPPTLPHYDKHCRHCFFCYEEGNHFICCNPNHDERWAEVYLNDTCDDWKYNEEEYSIS